MRKYQQIDVYIYQCGLNQFKGDIKMNGSLAATKSDEMLHYILTDSMVWLVQANMLKPSSFLY